MVKDLWEDLDFYTSRMKVPGGWIVRDDKNQRGGICFFPDPTYEWKVKHEFEPAPIKTAPIKMEAAPSIGVRVTVTNKKQGFWTRFFARW